MGRDNLITFLDNLADQSEPVTSEWQAEWTEPETGPNPAEQAATMKARILDALKLGQDAGPILYAALDCIGVLSSDPEWAQAGQAILNRTFEGLEQADLFRDDNRVIAERLDALADEQRAKTRAYLQRAISKAQKLQKDAETALQNIPLT